MPGTFYIIRTVPGREETVIDFLCDYIKKSDVTIYSLVLPPGLKGYIFAEADNIYEVQRAIKGIPHTRGVITKPVKFEEIEHLVILEKRKIEIKKGDIVEIIAGPFKGSKARVIRYNEQSEEVTVELIDSPVPIPITLKVDDVKVVRKEEEVKKELEEKEKELEKELEEEWLKF